MTKLDAIFAVLCGLNIYKCQDDIKSLNMYPNTEILLQTYNVISWSLFVWYIQSYIQETAARHRIKLQSTVGDFSGRTGYTKHWEESQVFACSWLFVDGYRDMLMLWAFILYKCHIPKLEYVISDGGTAPDGTVTTRKKANSSENDPFSKTDVSTWTKEDNLVESTSSVCTQTDQLPEDIGRIHDIPETNSMPDLPSRRSKAFHKGQTKNGMKLSDEFITTTWGWARRLKDNKHFGTISTIRSHRPLHIHVSPERLQNDSVSHQFDTLATLPGIETLGSPNTDSLDATDVDETSVKLPVAHLDLPNDIFISLKSTETAEEIQNIKRVNKDDNISLQTLRAILKHLRSVASEMGIVNPGITPKRHIRVYLEDISTSKDVTDAIQKKFGVSERMLDIVQMTDNATFSEACHPGNGQLITGLGDNYSHFALGAFLTWSISDMETIFALSVGHKVTERQSVFFVHDLESSASPDRLLGTCKVSCPRQDPSDDIQPTIDASLTTVADPQNCTNRVYCKGAQTFIKLQKYDSLEEYEGSNVVKFVDFEANTMYKDIQGYVYSVNYKAITGKAQGVIAIQCDEIETAFSGLGESGTLVITEPDIEGKAVALGIIFGNEDVFKGVGKGKDKYALACPLKESLDMLISKLNGGTLEFVKNYEGPGPDSGYISDNIFPLPTS